MFTTNLIIPNPSNDLSPTYVPTNPFGELNQQH